MKLVPLGLLVILTLGCSGTDEGAKKKAAKRVPKKTREPHGRGH